MSRQDDKWVDLPDGINVGRAFECCLRSRLRAVSRFLELAATQPDDSTEYVHQLRVSTRRAIAVLDLFRNTISPHRAKRLRRQLKSIRDAASNARDLDVLLARATGKRSQDKSYRERIIRDRRKAQQPIEEAHVKLANRGGLSRRVAKLRRDVKAKRKRRQRTLLGDWAQSAWKSTVEQFLAAEPHDMADLKALHRFRIAGKKLRYTMELLAATLGRDVQKPAYRSVCELQEHLGQINDHAVAVIRLQRWIDDKKTKKRKRKLLHSEMKREQRRLAQRCEAFVGWWTKSRRRQFREQLGGAWSATAAPQ